MIFTGDAFEEVDEEELLHEEDDEEDVPGYTTPELVNILELASPSYTPPSSPGAESMAVDSDSGSSMVTQRSGSTDSESVHEMLVEIDQVITIIEQRRTPTPVLPVYDVQADPNDVVAPEGSFDICVICRENIPCVILPNCEHKVYCATCHSRQMCVSTDFPCPICRKMNTANL